MTIATEIERILADDNRTGTTHLVAHLVDLFESYGVESAKQKEAEGWVLVPKEPTRRMVEILAYHPVAEGDQAQALDVYRAMLAAVPEPPSALLSAGGEG